MKKLVILLLALMFAATALAEAPVSLDWSEIAGEIEGSGIEGDFVEFETAGMKIWLPAGLEPEELTEDDQASGYLAYFSDADQSAHVGVVFEDMGGTTMEQFIELLNQDESAMEVMAMTINGQPAVTYIMPEEDCAFFAVMVGSSLFEVNLGPISEEGADAVWGLVGASIQPIG